MQKKNRCCNNTIRQKVNKYLDVFTKITFARKTVGPTADRHLRVGL